MLRRWGDSEARDEADRFQFGPALGAGFIAGAVLLFVPRGSPWSVFTFFAPVIMGRIALPFFALPLPAVWAIHLALSLLYGLLISLVVSRLHQERAVLAGAIMGLVLYVLNWGAVAFLWPQWRNSQFAVLFTHLVFGLISAAAYRGLLRRRAVPDGGPGSEPS